MSLHLSKPLGTHLAEPGPRQPTLQVKPTLATFAISREVRTLTKGAIVESNETKSQVHFEGSLAPSPTLIDGERVLESFDATFWDHGISGLLFRQKDRIVVTTHRIFQFSSRLASFRLRFLELDKAETVAIGSRLNLFQVLVAIIMLVAFVFFGWVRLFSYGSRAFQDPQVLLALLLLPVGIVLLVTARKKVLRVCGGNSKDAVELPLRRIRVEESQRFLDLVSQSMRGNVR